MSNNTQPLISADQKLPEITLRAILLAIVLAIILAASNTYLALKIGILTSASIPAAILAMGILRFFKNPNILESNLVQTAASAGEAVAGGIVYTIPALVIIHYWTNFSYWENLAIALSGGALGVLFSIPLRRALMNAPHLYFPEGRAIAELLRIGTQKALGMREMISGGAVGALLELGQTGFKVIGNSVQGWFVAGNTMFGFGGGFSATLIGAGYLIGFNVALSILFGALIVWGFGVPILSTLSHNVDATQTAVSLYGEKIHYMGIGAMLIAGIWTLLTLLKPFYESIRLSVQIFFNKNLSPQKILRTDRDIPLAYVFLGILTIAIFIYFLLHQLFHVDLLNIPAQFNLIFLLGCLFYILIIGFIFSAICGYFSGLVGVSASPGSAVIIAGMLLAALILRTILSLHTSELTQTQLLNAAAITIIIGSVITGAAAIANDNIQDLKVGHIIGATPWKQQVMLLLGVVTAAAVIPPIMNVLFNVYGIAGVVPHAGIDPLQTLPAPPAAMMAALTQGVFNHDLPWDMLEIGALIIIVCIVLNKILEKHNFSLSILAIALGMYFPLASSVPLFIGGLFGLMTKLALQKRQIKTNSDNYQRGLLLACGLVSGAALMDVVLAIPMALAKNPNVLTLLPTNWSSLATGLGILSVIGLGNWFYRVVCKGI